MHTFVKFIGWHQFHRRNTKTFQICALFHNPLKGSSVFDTGGFVHGKPADIQSINHSVFKGDEQRIVPLPVKDFPAQGTPCLSLFLSEIPESFQPCDSPGIRIREDSVLLIIIIARIRRQVSLHPDSVQRAPLSLHGEGDAKLPSSSGIKNQTAVAKGLNFCCKTISVIHRKSALFFRLEVCNV